jgi:NAD(P)-dependent dehydrogenase (short-subunit alcohol dehydrogenase family)
MDETWLGLEGARVLIAGAGGIGQACAIGYLEAGANVLIADRDADRVAALAQHPVLSAAQTEVVDLTVAGAAAQLVATAVDRLGGLDVALHSVGINDRRPALDFTDDEWDRVMDVNFTTAVRLTQAAGRHMVAQKSGRILLLSSVSGLLAHRDHAPYAASKGAINQMMRVMANEWAASGVTVNAIAPGYVETELTSAYLQKPGVRDRLESQVPAGRLGSADDIVGPALFLSSDRSSFVTGHVLYVDGGRTLV